MLNNIVIEGGDCSGKTTLQKSFLGTDVGRKYFISDRSILTRYAYALANKDSYIYKECYKAWEYDLATFLSKNAMIILIANEDVLHDRQLKRGQCDADKIYNILKVNKEYRHLAEMYKSIPAVLVLDTSDCHVENAYRKAANWIDNLIYRCDHPGYHVENLRNLIKVFGDNIGSTRELRNFKISFITSDLNSSSLSGLLDNAWRLANKNNSQIYDLAIKNWYMFAHKMQHELAYAMKKAVIFNKQYSEASRQYHIVNEPGSCISTFGVAFRDKNDYTGNNKLDMHISVHFRSSDIDVLPHDMLEIYNVAAYIYARLGDIVGDITDKDVDRFIFNIDFDNIHEILR